MTSSESGYTYEDEGEETLEESANYPSGNPAEQLRNGHASTVKENKNQSISQVIAKSQKDSSKQSVRSIKSGNHGPLDGPSDLPKNNFTKSSAKVIIGGISKDFTVAPSQKTFKSTTFDIKKWDCCEHLDEKSCSDETSLFSTGDLVFVKYNGLMWPGVIEDPINSERRLTRNQFVIFLYGIHQRVVIGSSSLLYPYDKHRQKYRKVKEPEILIYALLESRTNPGVNQKIIPEHLLPEDKLPQDCNYAILKNRRGVSDSSIISSIPIPSLLTDSGQPVQRDDKAYFSMFTATSIDVWMGRLALVVCGLVAVYMTLWLVVLPFTDPPVYSVLRMLFPKVENGLAVMVATVSLLISSIVVYVQVQLYSPDDDIHLTVQRHIIH